jgi:hypothetical protein
MTTASWRWLVHLRWRGLAIALLLVYHVTPFADHPWIAALFVTCVCGGAIWDYRKGDLCGSLVVRSEIEIEIEGDHIWIGAHRADYSHSKSAFEADGLFHLNGDPRDGPWTLFPAEALTQDQRMRFIGLLRAKYGIANCKIPERPNLWRSLLTDIILIALIVVAVLRAS